MSLYVKKDVPFKLIEISLINANDKQLIQISTELSIGLNLTKESEFGIRTMELNTMTQLMFRNTMSQMTLSLDTSKITLQ